MARVCIGNLQGKLPRFFISFFSLVTQSASSDVESNSPCYTPTLEVMKGFQVALIVIIDQLKS